MFFERLFVAKMQQILKKNEKTSNLNKFETKNDNYSLFIIINNK